MALKDNTASKEKDEAIEVIYKKGSDPGTADLVCSNFPNWRQGNSPWLHGHGRTGSGRSLIQEKPLYLKDADITMVLNIDKEALKEFRYYRWGQDSTGSFNILANAVRFSEKAEQ